MNLVKLPETMRNTYTVGITLITGKSVVIKNVLAISHESDCFVLHVREENTAASVSHTFFKHAVVCYDLTAP